MLSAAQAAYELIRRGYDAPHTGMDDPTEAGLSYCWWWDGAGVLCGSWWRGSPTVYGEFTLAGALEDVANGY